jgi:hypothetical protein
LPKYYKSRYLAEPIIYIQEDGQYRSVYPSGNAATVDGQIPETMLRSLDPIPVEQAEHLLVTLYHRSERRELSTLRQVYAYTSPASLVARASAEALRRMGWRCYYENGALIAVENYKWWRWGWAGYPQRFTVTLNELDGETLLTASHFNVGGSGRPGFINRTIEKMANLIDEVLREAGSNPPPGSTP